MSINASLLKRFCAEKFNPSKFLRKPWRRDGYVYASNGHVVLRVAADNSRLPEAPTGANMLPEIMPQLFADAPTAGFVPVPATVFEPPKCGTCNGSGKRRYRHCPDCDGTGEFERGGHWYDCRTCVASGSLPDEAGNYQKNCPDCDGTGIDNIVGDPRVAIGPAEFNAKYIALLGDLPSCEIAVRDAHSAAALRFDGGDGLLMPMRM